LPLHPLKYAELLAHRASKHGSNVYLVNTGWTRGPYGVGSRISIKYTRAMVSAALDGSLDRVPYSKDPVFNVMVPDYCPNVPTELLKPRGCWEDKQAYDRTANELARSFVQNFSKFTSMPEEVKMAGPVVN